MIIDPIVPEDGNDMFRRNINDCTQINTVSLPKDRNAHWSDCHINSCILKYTCKKVKLSLCLNTMNVRGNGRIAPPFLISVLEGCEWSASRSDRFTPINPPPPWYPLNRRLDEPEGVHPVAHRYTDLPIPVPVLKCNPLIINFHKYRGLCCWPRTTFVKYSLAYYGWYFVRRNFCFITGHNLYLKLFEELWILIKV
jgi:hypothetical protein